MRETIVATHSSGKAIEHVDDDLLRFVTVVRPATHTLYIQIIIIIIIIWV